MAIDVKTIACPQCGSTDVNMTSETHGICKSCGAKFAVQPRIETQNVYNEIHVDGSSESQDLCVKAEIKPAYTKDQFIRKAWITLASEDAPLEIFNENFSEVKEIDHQVLMESIEVDVAFQASIGYDRQESYTKYETYYEKESYTDYNKDGKPFTQYRTVEKTRPVTKYKTVTDWRPLNGNLSKSSKVIIENMEEQADGFYPWSFEQSFRGISAESIIPLDGAAGDNMKMSDDARDNAAALHLYNINGAVQRSLPGDHYKDLDWKISKITDSTTALYKTKEYKTTICMNGETYEKRGFPFGEMAIVGSKIENEMGLDAVTGKMKSELESKINDRKNAINKNISKATNGISILTIGLLVASILVSVLIKSTPLVVGVFAIAVAAFVFNTIKVKSETAAENKHADSEIANETSKVNSEIADYSKNYKIKQREALNNKLKSLGFEPAAESEM